MNKKTITLLLTSTGCLLNESRGRSLLGLQQSLRSMDEVDDVMQKFEQPDVDLEQTLEDNIKIKVEPVHKPKKQVVKPSIIKVKKQENKEPQGKLEKAGLIGNDNIAAASTEDMYAFSQVLASGGSVNKAVKALEEEAQD